MEVHLGNYTDTLTTERDQLLAIANAAIAYAKQIDRQIAGRRADDDYERLELAEATLAYWQECRGAEDMLEDARRELGLDGDDCDRHNGSERYKLAREGAL